MVSPSSLGPSPTVDGISYLRCGNKNKARIPIIAANHLSYQQPMVRPIPQDAKKAQIAPPKLLAFISPLKFEVWDVQLCLKSSHSRSSTALDRQFSNSCLTENTTGVMQRPHQLGRKLAACLCWAIPTNSLGSCFSHRSDYKAAANIHRSPFVFNFHSQLHRECLSGGRVSSQSH